MDEGVTPEPNMGLWSPFGLEDADVAMYLVHGSLHLSGILDHDQKAVELLAIFPIRRLQRLRLLIHNLQNTTIQSKCQNG